MGLNSCGSALFLYLVRCQSIPVTYTSLHTAVYLDYAQVALSSRVAVLLAR